MTKISAKTLTTITAGRVRAPQGPTLYSSCLFDNSGQLILRITHANDKLFAGSIPELYQSHLVPLLFEPFAADLADRLCLTAASRVLEIAAGTGILTRALARRLNHQVPITATDLNQGMLEQAVRIGTVRPVEWRQADALALPFPDRSFDAVICQFAVMFFPNKAKAFSEARRVLMPGGTLLFNVWDRLSENGFAETVTSALASLFPANPPSFMARTPHGYWDMGIIERELRAAGFSDPPRFTRVTARSRASAAAVVATAFCQGTPLRHEIETLAPSRLLEITESVAKVIAQRFGSGPIDAKMQAIVVSIRRTGSSDPEGHRRPRKS